MERRSQLGVSVAWLLQWLENAIGCDALYNGRVRENTKKRTAPIGLEHPGYYGLRTQHKEKQGGVGTL